MDLPEAPGAHRIQSSVVGGLGKFDSISNREKLWSAGNPSQGRFYSRGEQASPAGQLLERREIQILSMA